MASQIKRLCVRDGLKDDSRVQHNSATSTSGLNSDIAKPAQGPSTNAEQQSHLNSRVAPAQTLSSDNLPSTQSALTTESKKMLASVSANNQSEVTSGTTSASNGTSQMSSLNGLNKTKSTDFSGISSNSVINHKSISKFQKYPYGLDLVKVPFHELDDDTLLERVMSTRNFITASNKKKQDLTQNPGLRYLIEKFQLYDTDVELKVQIALLICSIAKCNQQSAKLIIDNDFDTILFSTILDRQQYQPLVEASLRCLRSLAWWPGVSTLDVLYDAIDTSDDGLSKEEQIHSNLQHLINMASRAPSLAIQECIIDIITFSCSSDRRQTLLYNANILPCVTQLLESISYRVIISAINCCNQLCTFNEQLSQQFASSRCPSGLPVLDRLRTLMMGDMCMEIQFLSARCYLFIIKNTFLDHTLDDEDSRLDEAHFVPIELDVLPTFARMIQKDKSPYLRCKSASCLADLIKKSTRLQRTASYLDHLISSLADMLEYEGPNRKVQHSYEEESPEDMAQYNCSATSYQDGNFWMNLNMDIPDIHPPRSYQDSILAKTVEAAANRTRYATSVKKVQEVKSDLADELRQASFMALAALCSNLWQTRLKIATNAIIMDRLVKSLTETNPDTLKAALRCLLSISRSVHQLRTSFVDRNIFNPLKSLLLSETSEEILVFVLAIVCNISLEFSPGKHHFLDDKTIETICELTKRPDPNPLKLHGMWILMNIVYNDKNQELKNQIVTTLGMDTVLAYLKPTGANDELTVKALGFLRNVLSQRKDIDATMTSYGEEIMESLLNLVESPRSDRVKEQVLCVLTNIADGLEAKKHCMTDRVLGHLRNWIFDDHGKNLRLAAIGCIINLAHKRQDGSAERREVLKKYGIEDKLKQLLNHYDAEVVDRSRTAYGQFLKKDDQQERGDAR